MTEAAPKPWIKWIVLGCSGLIVVGLLAAAGIVSLVMGGIKKSGAFEEALEKARAHPAVIAALGEPMEPGFFVGGSVSVEGPSGEAALSFPLAGPRGKGTIYLEAKKRAGRWEFGLLELAVAGREERIDLLAEE